MLPDKIPGCRIYTYNWNSATSNEASQEHVDSLVLSLVDRLGGREVLYLSFPPPFGFIYFRYE